MKIAQVAPLTECVPPITYGGIERVVSYLTEALVEQGHQVTLFASGDSSTEAELYSVVPRSLRLSGLNHQTLALHLDQLAAVAERADEFDIIHFHVNYFDCPLFDHIQTPCVTTTHGRLDLPDLLASLKGEASRTPLISISDSQRRPIPDANWISTVFNGVPADSFDYQSEKGDYLAFVGRMSEEKGPEQAIQIALATQIPLKMGAKVDSVDEAFFRARVEPYLDHPLIEFVGEVNQQQKNELFGNALATLFPINWPEPFGLVMIESMACGTPVIAFERGAVPEVMRHGQTGFVVNSVEEAIEAVSKIHEISRLECRQHFERHFTDRQMARGYVAAYQKLIARSHEPARGGRVRDRARRAEVAGTAVFKREVKNLFDS